MTHMFSLIPCMWVSSVLSCCTCSLLMHIPELKQWYHAAVVPAMATCGCALWDNLTTNLRWVSFVSHIIPHTYIHSHRSIGRAS